MYLRPCIRDLILVWKVQVYNHAGKTLLLFFLVHKSLHRPHICALIYIRASSWQFQMCRSFPWLCQLTRPMLFLHRSHQLIRDMQNSTSHAEIGPCGLLTLDTPFANFNSEMQLHSLLQEAVCSRHCFRMQDGCCGEIVTCRSLESVCLQGSICTFPSRRPT